jgi:hypothetical protein
MGEARKDSCKPKFLTQAQPGTPAGRRAEPVS